MNLISNITDYKVYGRSFLSLFHFVEVKGVSRSRS